MCSSYQIQYCINHVANSLLCVYYNLLLCYNLLIFLIFELHTSGNTLPKEIEFAVLQSVVVLLINTHETSLICKYLQPLDDHVCVFRFNQFGQQTELVTYYIGKCGACPAAVRVLSPRFVVCDNANTVLMMADQCFPNLGAVISVGVACGIKNKVELCDVLVSSKVINYDKATYGRQGYLPKGEAVPVSSHLLKLFVQPVQWPNDKIRKLLSGNYALVPKVQYGTILSGPYVVDDPAIRRLIKTFADKTMGIEIDGAHVFTENHPIKRNTIIVKGVCDFEDGKNINIYKSIAASVAVNLVHKCLSDPQALEILEGLNT